MKRNNNNIVVLIIAVVLLVIYITFQVTAKPKTKFNWTKTYKDALNQPYDFGVFKSILKQKAGSGFTQVEKDLGKFLKEVKKQDPTTLVYIGQYAYLTKSEINEMLNFAEEGHQILLVSEGFPDTLINALCQFGKPLSVDRFDHSVISVESFNNNTELKNYKFVHQGMQNQPVNTDWYYLNEDQGSFFDFVEVNTTYLKLNSINGRLNFAKFKMGDGFVYLHTTPMLFTNLALNKDSGFIYLDEIFDGIETEHILYDISSRELKTDYETISHQSDSPLSYILKQDSLKWAWYAFLATVLLFFLFRAKRKQRIVPVIEKKKNSSINFIETLSGLFYKNANHKQMAETKMQLFLYFLRHKLKVPTHDINQETIRLISLKAGVSERDIGDIFDYYNFVVKKEEKSLSTDYLMEFHNRISRFYQSYQSKNNQK